MAEGFRERIDMAVLGPNPGYVRASIRLRRLQSLHPGRIAAFLARIAARSAEVLSPSDPRLEAWRRAYAAVGLTGDPVPPPEALLAWARSSRGVPSQAPLADLANAFSLQHAVPVAAYDLDACQGDLWLRPSRGIEHYAPLDGGPPTSPPIGEAILADSADVVMARQWHGAPGRDSFAGPTTRQALVHIDLLPPAGAERHAAALAESFVGLACGFLGGEGAWQLLTWDAPQAAWPGEGQGRSQRPAQEQQEA